MTWATATGTSIVGSLVPTDAEYQSTIVESGVTYGFVKYSFSGSPNLSSVLTGHNLTVAGFTNSVNNGTYRIYSANDATDEITVYNTSRLSASLDETGITGTGSVASGAAVINEPSAAKKALGFKTPEKPSDGMWNWLINDIYTSVASALGRSVNAITNSFQVTASSYTNLVAAAVSFATSVPTTSSSYTPTANDNAFEDLTGGGATFTTGANRVFFVCNLECDSASGIGPAGYKVLYNNFLIHLM